MQTAVSRGIPTGAIIRRHILRNAAIPITTITGDHHRLADRGGRGGRDRVQPQRPRRLPGPGRAVQGPGGGAGHLAGPGHRVRRGQRARRPAVRGARPAGLARERRREHDRHGASGRRRGAPQPPPRGCGHRRRRDRSPRPSSLSPRSPPLRAAAGAVQPDRPRHLAAVASARSAGTCSASTSRAATCCPGCWPARSRRCSGPLAVVAISLPLGIALAVTSAWSGARLTRCSAGLDILFAFPASCSRCWPRRCSAPA